MYQHFIDASVLEAATVLRQVNFLSYIHTKQRRTGAEELSAALLTDSVLASAIAENVNKRCVHRPRAVCDLASNRRAACHGTVSQSSTVNREEQLRFFRGTHRRLGLED